MVERGESTVGKGRGKKKEVGIKVGDGKVGKVTGKEKGERKAGEREVRKIRGKEERAN